MLLACTPLNLPRVFLYALYFTLMPVAVLGPAAGVAGTAVLAGVAAYLWLWGTPAALDSFLWFWLVWSLVDWVFYLLFRLVLGIWEYRRARVRGCHSVFILVRSHTAAKMSISLRS